MDASTTTTIRGVSILSRQRKRKADVFDITLSHDGITIRRPGRAEQHMGWGRITQWEIQERPGCVVLTLRGIGSVTPLLVKGWTLEDLETVMREVTGPADDWEPPPPSGGTATALLALETPATKPAQPAGPDPAESVQPAEEAAEPVQQVQPVDPTNAAQPAEPVQAAEAATSVQAPEPVQRDEPVPPPAPSESVQPARPAVPLQPAEAATSTQAPEPVQPRASRRHAAPRPQRRVGRALVTVALLGVVATAVVVVLLQSAGLIDWSFLGPVA
jgi:hypothetical protein